MVPPRRAAPLPGFIPLLDKTLERVGSCAAMDISPEMSRFRIEGARHGRSRQAGSPAFELPPFRAPFSLSRVRSEDAFFVCSGGNDWSEGRARRTPSRTVRALGPPLVHHCRTATERAKDVGSRHE